VVLLKNNRWVYMLLVALVGQVSWAKAATVVTSSHPLAMIAAELAPAAITVESIGGSNHSVHHQGFKPSQIKRVNDAVLVLWLGGAMDAGFTKVVAQAEPRAIKDLGALVSLQRPLSLVDDHKSHEYGDVHVWLNPRNARTLATAIAVQLIVKWPQYKDQISDNLRQFSIKIDAISTEFLEKYDNRDFLALHDAYGHLAAFYDLSSLGSIVAGGGEKPGAQHLWQLEKQLSKRTAVCTLVQPQFSQRYLASIGKVVELVIVEIDPGASGYTATKGEFVRYSMDIAESLARCLRLENKG
jgi:zinc transport system substrate-binding protein